MCHGAVAQCSTSLSVGALSRNWSLESPSECTQCNSKRRQAPIDRSLVLVASRLSTAPILPHGSCAPPPSSDQLDALAKDLRTLHRASRNLRHTAGRTLRGAKLDGACAQAGGLLCRDDVESGSAVLQIILQIGLATEALRDATLTSPAYATEPLLPQGTLLNSPRELRLSSARVKAQARAGTSLCGKTRPSPAAGAAGPHCEQDSSLR